MGIEWRALFSGGKGDKSGEIAEGLGAGARTLVDFLAPGAMREAEDHIVFPGQGCVRVWFIQDVPPEMPREALDAIYDFPGEIVVSLLTRPMDKAAVRSFLRQQRVAMQAEAAARLQQQRLLDYSATAELEQIEQALRDLELTHQVPQELCWSVALWAEDKEQLDEQSRRLEDLMMDADLTFFRASLRQEEGLYTVQPFGLNFLGHARNINTLALAGMFPFARRTWADPQGIPYGVDRTTGAWVIVDDFSLDNYNMIIIGEQGSGKSMFLKYKATWAVLLGMRCFIIDLEGEFEPMCRRLGGVYLDMALTSPHKMNVFDLNPLDPAAWMNGLQDTLAWIEIAVGGLTMAERNVILAPAYKRVMEEAGIMQDDPRTWKGAPPRLSDLYAVLRADERRAAQDLADRLESVAVGIYREAFDCHTNVETDSPLVVFGLRDVHRDMQPLRMRQIQTFIWSKLLTRAHPTLVIIDEAWRWLSQPGAAADLAEMARRFRKRYAGLQLSTQHGDDLSRAEDAVVIRDTAAMTMLFRQGASAIPSISELFSINEVEARELISLDRGESILIIGQVHLPLYTPIPPALYRVWTTDPRELAAIGVDPFERTGR